MMKNLFAILLTLAGLPLFAQEIGYGFKAGLNFNQTQSDPETANGAEVEEFTGNTGFHVGATFTWKATDIMGMRGELLYSQKGGRRTFEGPSYFTLLTTTADRVPTTGTRKQSINLTTSYLDIPVVGYIKPIKKLEIYAGASFGLLLSASVFGEMKYSNGMTAIGDGVEEFRYEIDGNYGQDRPGQAFFSNPPKTVSIGGSAKADIPNTAGVYYEFDEDPGKPYKTVDFGLVGGLSYFLSGSLFVSGRINYGLTDITKQRADVSFVSKEGNEFITRDDDDRHFSLQFSIGFAF